MKKRFYIDVPEYGNPPYGFYAQEIAPLCQPLDGNKRIAFDVDFPPTVFKTHSEMAVASLVGFIEDKKTLDND